MKILIDFGLAWRLLTVIPLPFIPEDFKRPAGRAAGYYPLVGLLLGLLLASVDQLFYFIVPPQIGSALLIAVWAGLTGLLHLDGFMDTCDGLLPPREPAQRLEIMKDSRVGAFGAVGVVLLLILKFNSLVVLPSPYLSPTLITIPILARTAMTWLMWRYPPARKEGLGILFITGLGWPQMGLAITVASVVSVVLFGFWGLLLLAITWATATLIAQFTIARIGGLTGDIYGATCELVEVVLLITIVAITL